MAKFEESNASLPTEKQPEENNDSKSSAAAPDSPSTSDKQPPEDIPMGLPVGHGVMGEGRARWDSGLFACVGRNDEFWSSDLEVCVLGVAAPCVLYGSNVERIGPAPGTFAAHCLPYTVLYLIGDSCFRWNCLAPWFSYPSRTAIRRKYNLEGSYETLARIFGCKSEILEDDLRREKCESACDIVTHVICHACSLCQEGREVRRRIPHPGYNARAQPVLVMIPPGEQTMGR